MSNQQVLVSWSMHLIEGDTSIINLIDIHTKKNVLLIMRNKKNISVYSSHNATMY